MAALVRYSSFFTVYPSVPSVPRVYPALDTAISLNRFLRCCAALCYATSLLCLATLLLCLALLCFVAAHAVVIYVPLVSFFAFSWLLSMRLFIVVGVSCCGCGKVAFAIVVICQLIARCSAHSALVSVGSVQRLS